MNPPFNNPTQVEQDEFLFRLYFGSDKDDLTRCIWRAYLDLCRTVHGIAKHPSIYAGAETELRKAIANLPRYFGQLINQDKFDDWHREQCDKLIGLYKNGGYAENGNDRFTHGQAQKWINMTLKYVFVFGEDRLPGYQQLYGYCHVPIDNIIIDRLKAKCSDVPPLEGAPWSRLEKYDTYLTFQRWVRDRFPGSAPLAVEFFLWQEKAPEV